MSYHIVSVDSPTCSLSSKNGQLVFKDGKENKSLPLEDVSAIIVTSFSASFHSKLLVEASCHKIALIVCENFKPVSLVLPANRSTDTLLTRAQIKLTKKSKNSLWLNTIDAKTFNQVSLARHIAPNHPLLSELEKTATNGTIHKEPQCARAFWKIYADAIVKNPEFRREQERNGVNALLNYGYTVLLSCMLQRCFAMGIDPTFGIGHATREHSTPLAYDLMEPFRPLVDWHIANWLKNDQFPESRQVNKEFRSWMVGILREKVEYSGSNKPLENCMEAVIRSFRKSLTCNNPALYKPWIQRNSKWDGC